MHFTTLAMSALVALASAYTQPDYSQPPSGNPIAYPGLAQQVPKGEPFTIQWDPTTAGPISLVLLQGPSSNVVPYQTIVENIPNSGKYVWTPAESIPDDVTHYGLLLVDDATGEYQWSTQFGICEADGSYTTTSASAKATSTAASSTVTAAPTATAVTVTEEESTTICPETETGSSASVTATPTPTAVTVTEEVSTTICPETESQTAAPTTIPIVIGTGTSSVPLIHTSAPASASSTLVSSAYASSTPTKSSVSATYTGAAGRNVISFGAVAAGVMAVLAF